MKKPNPMMSAMTSATACIIGMTLTSLAVENAADPEESRPFTDLWDMPHIYSDSESYFLSDLKIIGRYQWQHANANSDQGDYDDWEHRRWRLGTEAKVLGGDWKLKGEINIDSDFSPLYKNLEEAYIKYQGNPAFNLTVGKHKPTWSYEFSTSSRKILTFERSLLVNQLAPKKTTGVSASGKVDEWSYVAGIFSGQIDEEFGELDGGEFTLASIGYDYSKKSGFDEAGFKLDWLHNTDEANNAAKPYKNSLSLNHSLSQGQFGLNTDLIYADGYSADAYGIVLLPTYDITDKLQLVGRYTNAHGDNDSLKVQKRYEGKVPSLTDSGKGENYQSIYLGLNYYLNDHKLKLMGGFEYSSMDDNAGDGGDYDGWTVFTGLRLYF